MSDSSSEVQYTKSVVSFIDLLGFKKIVQDAKDEPDRVRGILDLVRRSGTDTIIEPHPMDAAVIIFSDSIIRARPIESFDDPLDALFTELNALGFIQRDLLHHELVVRGGVTIGDIFIDPKDGIVFGPAYQRAYEIESKLAVYPRILIDDNVVDELDAAQDTSGHTDDDKELVRDFLARDDARCWYLDYLRTLQTDEAEDMGEFIRRHRDVIAGRLAEYDPTSREYRKYAWLAEYHNAFIQERIKNEAEATELMIP